MRRGCRRRGRTFTEWLFLLLRVSQILRHRDKEVCLPKISPSYSLVLSSEFWVSSL